MLARHFKILGMFALSGFLPPFIARSIDLALPCIAHEFSMPLITLSWIITAYLLATAVMIIPLGRVADIVGRKKIFLAGTVLFTVSTFLCAIATSGAFLIASRVIQGIASAMIFATANALLIALFSAQERGKALGINVAGIYLGSSLGPSLGGFMTQFFGWRSIFVLTTMLSVCVVLIATTYLDDDHPETHGESFDALGSFMYAVSMIGMLFGMTLLPTFNGTVLLLIGLILFGLFCVVEEYAKHPVLHVRLLLRNKVFALSSLAALLNFAAVFSLMFLLSLYLQYVHCLDAQSAGLIMLASPVTIFFGSPIAGKLSDVVDPRIIASWGMGLSSLALLGLCFLLNASTSYFFMIMLLIIFGCGSALFASPNTNAAMSSVPSRQLGVAASVINTMRLFGQTLSMGIATLVLTLYMGNVGITQHNSAQLTQGIQAALFVLAVLCCLGMLASIRSYTIKS